MKRPSLRARALILSGVLTAALLTIGFTVPTPYVALGPGVTHNVLGEVGDEQVITFGGSDVPSAAAEQPSGHLNMTTISVYGGIDTAGMPLLTALGMWLSGDYAIVPREEIYPPDRTVEQVNEQNAQLFTESQSAAEIAALRYLEYPEVVYVGTIPEGSPSEGVLDPQDRIIAIDGTPVTGVQSLLDALADTSPGQIVAVTVLRDDEELTEKVTLMQVPDSDRGALGVRPESRPVAPFTISISLGEIGGPSAGLMFTLGIIDRLSEGDLTGGHFVAGTGTINNNGPGEPATVGAIGGVIMKQIAARAAGAEFFLVPADNCAEAVTFVPDGLTQVRVATLDDATAALAEIRAGAAPQGC